MSLLIDGTSASAGTWANVSSYNWTHTVGAALNAGALFVTAQIRDLGTVNNGSITGITWNSGVTQNLVKDVQRQNSTDGLWSAIWHVLTPNSGLGTVTVTMAGAVNAATGGGISFSGVHQTTPTDGTAGGTAGAVAGGTVSITTTIDNDYVLDSLYEKTGSTATPGAGQTKIFELFPLSVGGTTGGGLGDTSDSSYKITTTAGAASTIYTWSGADDMCLAAVAIRPTPDATGFLPRMNLMGIG